jgi:hypothetical protein
MAENTQPAALEGNSLGPDVLASDSSATGAVWVTPAPVLLTSDQVMAALYAFSELIDDCAHPTMTAVREEVRFLVARHGPDEIERVAEWLAMHGPAPLSAVPHASAARMDRQPLPARLAWCHRQSRLLLAADA